MIQRLKRKIAQMRARLRRVDIGRTRARLHAARVQRNRHRRARQEYLDIRDRAEREYEKLIEEGRDPHQDHVRNVYVRMVKADNHADEHGQLRADLSRLYRRLREVFKGKSKLRRKLQRELREKRRKIRRVRQRQQAPPTSGVGSFDGKPIAAWMIPTMSYARSHGWNGSLTSGYRSPEYSEQLCYGICGAPYCPGRCAGRTSNHTKHVKPDGAVDVSDPAGFDRAQSTLINTLGAADPWHFSATGQ